MIAFGIFHRMSHKFAFEGNQIAQKINNFQYLSFDKEYLSRIYFLNNLAEIFFSDLQFIIPHYITMCWCQHSCKNRHLTFLRFFLFVLSFWRYLGNEGNQSFVHTPPVFVMLVLISIPKCRVLAKMQSSSFFLYFANSSMPWQTAWLLYYLLDLYILTFF